MRIVTVMAHRFELEVCWSGDWLLDSIVAVGEAEERVVKVERVVKKGLGECRQDEYAKGPVMQTHHGPVWELQGPTSHRLTPARGRRRPAATQGSGGHPPPRGGCHGPCSEQRG